MHEFPVAHHESDAAVALGRVLRARGASVPATDLLIAAIAIRNHATLLHCDRHFLAISKYSDLKQQAVGDLGKSS
jgi:predicted nucleic acid-binding protein